MDRVDMVDLADGMDMMGIVNMVNRADKDEVYMGLQALQFEFVPNLLLRL